MWFTYSNNAHRNSGCPIQNNKQFNNKTKLWKQNGRCLNDIPTALIPIENWRNININSVAQRLCSRLTALWRYINFVLLLLLLLLRENKNNVKRTDWKFRRVVENFEVGIEKVNHDAVDTSSKNLKVSRKRSTRSTSDTSWRTSVKLFFINKITLSLEQPPGISWRLGNSPPISWCFKGGILVCSLLIFLRHCSAILDSDCSKLGLQV